MGKLNALRYDFSTELTSTLQLSEVIGILLLLIISIHCPAER